MTFVRRSKRKSEFDQSYRINEAVYERCILWRPNFHGPISLDPIEGKIQMVTLWKSMERVNSTALYTLSIPHRR